MFLHGEKRVVFEDKEHDGYFYCVNRAEGNTIYLWCKDRNLHNCRVTAKIVDGDFVALAIHSHPVDHRLIRKKRFNDALYIAVTSSLRDSRIIYDELCEKDPDGATEVPFASAQTSMAGWRKSNCPPTPIALPQYVQLLEMEQWENFTNGRQLNVSIVRSEDGSTSVVYGDIEFLQDITSAPIYVDTTFAVCPRQPKVLQLLTIMIEIDDTRVPIAWSLMERKTYLSYLSVLQEFSTVLAPHIRPPSFMTDFERGLAAALQTVYPQAIAQRCYFHYCQTLMKKAKKERIFHRILHSEDMQIVFRKLMALPLLPPNDILAAFQWIVTNTPLDIATHFASFFDYMNTYWLNNVGPQVFSVFGMECRTNNAIESYHKVLRVRFGVHPSIWQFTESLCRLQTVIRSSNASLDAGIAITRQSKERHVVQQEILRRAWDFYLQQLLDIPRFLACASTFLKAFNHRHVMIEANDVNHFVVVNVPGVVFVPCALCGSKPRDTICLPCCHWIACAGCAGNLRLLAGSENADVRCSVCALIVHEFHGIIIVQQ